MVRSLHLFGIFRAIACYIVHAWQLFVLKFLYTSFLSSFVEHLVLALLTEPEIDAGSAHLTEFGLKMWANHSCDLQFIKYNEYAIDNRNIQTVYDMTGYKNTNYLPTLKGNQKSKQWGFEPTEVQ